MAQLLQAPEERMLSRDILAAISTDYGQIRLGKFRDYQPQVDQENLDFTTDCFLQWVTQDEWLLLKGTHFETGEQRKVAVKCSKRGNDVYNKRLDDRFSFLHRYSYRKKDFFSLEDFKPQMKVMAQMFWFTLTYDSKRCSLQDAWLGISREWNLWITNMRNRYGRIQVLKFIQAFPGDGSARGYPHIHAVLLFQDANFQVKPHWDQKKDGSEELSFRMTEKYEVAAQGKWHSWVDIKALKSVSSAVNYCRAYGQGTFEVVSEEGEVNDEALMNCSMNWYFKKRSFSVSGKFRESLHDLIQTLRNSKVFQCTLDGGAPIPIWKWEFLGVRSREELEKCGLDPPGWALEIEDPDAWEKIVRREYYRERWRID